MPLRSPILSGITEASLSRLFAADFNAPWEVLPVRGSNAALEKIALEGRLAAGMQCAALQ